MGLGIRPEHKSHYVVHSVRMGFVVN